MEENQNEKVPIHFPRITYCEFSSTGHRKYRVKSYKPPLSNYFHSDDPNEDLCHGFQADDDDVSISKSISIRIDYLTIVHFS